MNDERCAYVFTNGLTYPGSKITLDVVAVCGLPPDHDGPHQPPSAVGTDSVPLQDGGWPPHSLIDLA